MEKLQFQIVHNLKFTDKTCDEFTLEKGLKSERMRLLVEPIRAYIKNDNKEAADRLKKQLPAIMTSGLFGGRTAADLIQYSGVVTLDLDKIPEESVSDIKDKASKIPTTLMAFTSPSGRGLKCLVKVGSGPGEHREACKQVAAVYSKVLDVTFDEKTTDIARLTFMSFDPEVYYYPDSDVFHVIPSTDLNNPIIPPTTRNEDYANVIYQRAYQLTKKDREYEEGRRNDFIYRLAFYCNLFGLAKEKLLPMLGWSELSEQEKRSTVNSAYKNATVHGTWQLHNKVAEKPTVDGTQKSIGDPQSVEDVPVTNALNSGAENSLPPLPTLPVEVYDLLPQFFKGVTGHFSHAIERDIVLVSSVGVLSSAFPNVKGLYDRSKVGLNLYVFFVAPPSAGKGLMKWAWVLGSKIQKHLKGKFKREYAIFLKNEEGSERSKPVEKKFFIPANSSNAAIYDQIASNQHFGVMYDNEGDTLSQMFKNDWSNSSSILRKAFHHEPLSQGRKSKLDSHEIERPNMSVVLSGTPSQLPRLVDSIADGLFSRFLYLGFSYELVWKDKFSTEGESLEPVFDAAAEEVLWMWKAEEKSDETIIVVSETQRREINAYFSGRLQEFYQEHGEAIVPNVYRTCLIWYRIAMQLTTVRAYETGERLQNRLTIDDRDSRAALLIVDTLLEHLKVVFRDIMKQGAKKGKGKKEFLFEKLPAEKFEKSTYLKVVETLGIKQPTGEKWLKDLQAEGRIIKIEHGWYQKVG